MQMQGGPDLADETSNHQSKGLLSRIKPLAFSLPPRPRDDDLLYALPALCSVPPTGILGRPAKRTGFGKRDDSVGEDSGTGRRRAPGIVSASAVLLTAVAPTRSNFLEPALISVASSSEEETAAILPSTAKAHHRIIPTADSLVSAIPWPTGLQQLHDKGYGSPLIFHRQII